MTLRRHTAHCTFRGGLPCGSTPRHPALPSAPARCGRLARLWGTRLPPSLPCHLGPSALRPAPAQCGAICEAALPLCPPLCPGPLALSCPCLLALSRLALPLVPGCRVSGLLSLCPSPSVLSPPLPYLRPPASASTVRSNSRGNPPSLLPPSAPAPWPTPASCVFLLPRPPLLPFPGPWVPGPLSPCPRPLFTPPACTSRSNTRGIPPTPSSPCRPLAPWSLDLWHARRTAPACGLCPSTPALPPPPSPALFPLYPTQDTTQDTV